MGLAAEQVAEDDAVDPLGTSFRLEDRIEAGKSITLRKPLIRPADLAEV